MIATYLIELGARIDEPARCRVNALSADNDIASATLTALAFDTSGAVTDVGEYFFDAGTPTTLHVPTNQEGWYQFNATVQFDESTGTAGAGAVRGAVIQVNGAATGPGVFDATVSPLGGSQDTYLTVATGLYVPATDGSSKSTIELLVEQDSGTAMNVSGSLSVVKGHPW